MRIRLPALSCVLLLGSLASAAEPTIRAVSVRGLQIGGTTTITIDGDDLTTAPKLFLPFPATAIPQPNGTDKTATFTVTVPDTVTPGWHHLRVTTVGGVSLPVVIGVDRLPQRPFAPKIEKLPVALHGVLTGGTVLETKFDGTAKQKVVIEVEALRAGSKLRPILQLIGPDKKQLAWAWGGPSLGGDCRLEATLPADGTYSLTLHDAEYAGAAPGHFRLKVGEFAAVDGLFPPVIGSESKSVELLGVGNSANVTLPTKRESGFQRLPWPSTGNWTGPQPFVIVSTRREILEAGTSAAPQELPAGLLGVSGRLAKPTEEDRYRLPTTPGTKLRFDVFADRLGSPLDVSLILRNEAGVELARADDGPGTLDPTLEYTVPDKATSILVCVVDAQGRGGPRGIYRLTVDPVKAGEAASALKLSTPTGRVSIPANGVAVVPVLAERTNFPGPIRVSAPGLPKGVTLENAVIPEGMDGTLAVLKAAGAGETTVTTWSGEGATAFVRGNPLERIQPWLAQEVSVSVVPSGLPVKVEWRDLPPDLAIVPTRKFSLPVKVTRPDLNTPVRLTLLVGQFVPLVNGQPDANRAIRAERPDEIAVKLTDGAVPVLVPADLSISSCDVAIQADVLSADKRTVLATVFTPVKRLPVKMPVTVKLASAKVEAKLDPKLGYVAEFTGTAERLSGVTGDATLVVTGLPAGARLDPATAKVSASVISAKLIFPATAAPGTITNLKLTASAAPDPKVPGTVVKSREVELSVTIPKK